MQPVPTLCHVVANAAILEEQFDALGAVREDMQLDVVVLGRDAAQHATHQARLKLLQQAHGAAGGFTQLLDLGLVPGAAKEPLVLAHGRFDLFVPWQVTAVSQSATIGGFLLRKAEVGNALLDHDSRSLLRHPAALVIAMTTPHGKPRR
jgi:hypothetical protein